MHETVIQASNLGRFYS